LPPWPRATPTWPPPRAPISDREAQQLQALGDLRGAGSEQVIGLDGVAVIVHPDNPLAQLTTVQLAQIFSGQLSRWEQLGCPGRHPPYARDDRSGTFETFKALVLDPRHGELSAQARRFESADALAEQVKADRQAIGFSGLATVHGAKVLAVADGDAAALPPSRALVASEDYPLSRRLFFYLPANAIPRPGPWPSSPRAPPARPSSPSRASSRSRSRRCRCRRKRTCPCAT
jgi:phosphate transport system substrate-binding protein